MSKIGRRPIQLGDVKVDVKGSQVHYKGRLNSGVYELPDELVLVVDGNAVKLEPAQKKQSRDFNRIWGLHRALLANAITGAHEGFTKDIVITGLGYKAALAGSKVTFTLGYSHKIDFALPKGVTMEVDKTGQRLQLKSFDKQMLGQVCSHIKSLRKTEPYKGTGIKLSTDVVLRKAGKTKS
jgi:large subunit ribosomal protein L6